MIKPLLNNIKPTSGVAHVLHLLLVIVLPATALILVRLDFPQLAYSLVVLSKWRMFAVRPRFWAANLRANSVDLMVGLSLVLFMTLSGSLLLQGIWTAFYIVWLLFIKPRADIAGITAQAFIAQLVALSALYMWVDAPIAALSLLTGLFCFLAARHFLDAFDEPYAKLLALIWGYFGAALGWLLSHWLLYYGEIVAQPTLLLSALGYGMAVLYYLDHKDKLNKGLRRQCIFIMVAIVLVVLAFSDWGDKVV